MHVPYCWFFASSSVVTDLFSFVSSRQRQERQEIFVATSPAVQVEGCCSVAPRNRFSRSHLIQGLNHRKVGFDLVGHHRTEKALGFKAPLSFLRSRRTPVTSFLRL